MNSRVDRSFHPPPPSPPLCRHVELENRQVGRINLSLHRWAAIVIIDFSLFRSTRKSDVFFFFYFLTGFLEKLELEILLYRPCSVSYGRIEKIFLENKLLSFAIVRLD